MRMDLFLRQALRAITVICIVFLALFFVARAAVGQTAEPVLHVVAETPALPYIQAGLEWYSQSRPLELSAVPTENLGASDGRLHPGGRRASHCYSTPTMKTGMFVPLNSVGVGICVPEFRSQPHMVPGRSDRRLFRPRPWISGSSVSGHLHHLAAEWPPVYP